LSICFRYVLLLLPKYFTVHTNTLTIVKNNVKSAYVNINKKQINIILPIFYHYLGKYIELGAKNDYVNGKKLISKLFAVTPDWSGYLEKQSHLYILLSYYHHPLNSEFYNYIKYLM